jgi:hypothetical protein
MWLVFWFFVFFIYILFFLNKNSLGLKVARDLIFAANILALIGGCYSYDDAGSCFYLLLTYC